MSANDLGVPLVSENILIAESDAGLQNLYRRTLLGSGFEVETARDGLECLEALRRATPAALVLDLGLFWGGGEGVLAWLREEGRKSSPPVIITAASTLAIDCAAFHEPPVVACLRKPFTPSELLQTVQAAVCQPESASWFKKPSGASRRCRPEFPRRVFDLLLFETEAAYRRLALRPVRETGGRM